MCLFREENTWIKAQLSLACLFTEPLAFKLAELPWKNLFQLMQAGIPHNTGQVILNGSFPQMEVYTFHTLSAEKHKGLSQGNDYFLQ